MAARDGAADGGAIGGSHGAVRDRRLDGVSASKLPDIPGVETFAGHTMHTARWDHSVDLRGKRVGVVGTGASAIQVIPAVAPEVERLTVFQRTPIWCLPKLDAPLSARARRMLRWVPGAMLATRWLSQAFVELTFVLAAHFAGIFPGLRARGEGAAHKLLREVEDPAVREKLTPRYSLGCKRPSFHNEYVRTFNRDNVLLETAAIEEITPSGCGPPTGSSTRSTCWSSRPASRSSTRATCRRGRVVRS